MDCEDFRKIWADDAIRDPDSSALGHLQSCSACISWLEAEEARFSAWQEQRKDLFEALLHETVAKEGSSTLGLPSLEDIEETTILDCGTAAVSGRAKQSHTTTPEELEASRLYSFLRRIPAPPREPKRWSVGVTIEGIVSVSCPVDAYLVVCGFYYAGGLVIWPTGGQHHYRPGKSSKWTLGPMSLRPL